MLFLLLSIAAAQEPCSISGRVLDDNGRPVPFAAVTAWRNFTQSGGAAANDRGQYCIRGLMPGAYSLRVAERRTPPSASPDCKECCDPATEFAPAQTPEVTVRQPAVSDIRLRRVPAYCVRGEVRDGAGRLRGDVALSVSADSWSAAVLNEGGRFLLTSLPAGVYTLTVRDHPQLGRELARRAIHVKASNVAAQVIIIQ